MQKNPFQQKNDKYIVKPHISSNDAKNLIAKDLLKIYLGYWGTFIYWLVVSLKFIPMTFYLGAAMWILGGVSAMKLPQEAAKIANKTRFTMLSYLSGLIALRLIMYIILKTPTEIWAQTLMATAPEALVTSVCGFISMTFIISMFMGFASYVSYIFQLFTFHKTTKTVDEHMTNIMRKGGSK